ncbi:MAG: Ig-like domain-containing protein [Helicobacteraceae bacterium]|nr:Ig-like domain-containing protein [Helicobacteraceae bacterium]
MALTLVLSLCGCIEDKSPPDEYKNGRSQLAVNGAANGSILIASIFPRTPIIAEGGSIALTAVVTDGAGKILESTLAEPVSISWSSSNPSIASVNEKGGLFGWKLGSATITAVARKGANVSARYNIVAYVAKRNALDVAELFFNPMQAYIDMNVERVFRLSAVDYAGAPASLSEGRIKLETNNENVLITPQEINLTATGDAVEIRIKGLQKGFSFITPYYELASADGSETVRITGTPLVVQVKDSVETSLPPKTGFDGGGDLSIAVGEEAGGYKTIYASHYDKTAKGLLLSEFYSSWDHKTLGGGENTEVDAGRSNAIALSPFDLNRNLPMIVALKGKRVTLYYQRSRGGGWFETQISPTDVIDANRSYPTERVIDISAFRPPEDSSLPPLVNIAYYDSAQSRVCVVSYTSPTTQSAAAKCLATEAPPHSVSVAHNNGTGEPRMVYGARKYSYIAADGNETNVSEALYYVARQSGDLYREQIPIDGNAAHASIALDRNNKPMAALREGAYVRVYSREAEEATFKWARDPISGFDPVQGEIASVAFAVDGYNEPRLAFASNTGSGVKIRYARKPPFRNLGSRWSIDDPGQNIAGDQGASSAITLDSANRAHLVYGVANKKWFNYWAEPNFFDYRNYPIAFYSGADLISR